MVTGRQIQLCLLFRGERKERERRYSAAKLAEIALCLCLFVCVCVRVCVCVCVCVCVSSLQMIKMFYERCCLARLLTV